LPAAAGWGKEEARVRRATVLAIVRLFVFVAVVALVGFGSMIALVHLVEPEQRDYSVSVPPSAFNR